MIRYKRLEIGKHEKHTVEFKTTPFLGFEEVLIDKKSVFRQWAPFGIDRTFAVGENERCRVRVKSGVLEHLGLRPIFFTDSAVSAIGREGSRAMDRARLTAIALELAGYVAWPAAGLAIVLFFRHEIKHMIVALMTRWGS